MNLSLENAQSIIVINSAVINKRVIFRALIISLIIVAAAVLCGCAPAPYAAESERAPDKECVTGELVPYDGKTEHIFTHELVFDTAKAFAPDNSLRVCFDRDHLTAKEFASLLDELCSNGYVLIRLERALEQKTLMLPRGKKPLVMSFDDMTYDTVGRGCIDKLIISDGKLCDYTANAQPQITRNRENITILESFIERHPDFSFDGGRATVCVNGYNGILGYRITPDCRVSEKYRNKEIDECKKLIGYMKNLGYSFASHTYYHSYFKTVSAEKLEKDCAMWKKYVEPIVGETRVLCYPAGQHNAKSAKNAVFKKYGFDVFLCVGSYDGTEYEKSVMTEKYIYRRPFDGTALRLYGKLYAHLANTAAIYDSARFRPFSYKGGYN